MFFHKVKEVEGLKPVSSQNNSNKYNVYILKLSGILICCIVLNMTNLAQDMKLQGGFSQFSHLYRVSWYYQSLLFTNWCTIELL